MTAPTGFSRRPVPIVDPELSASPAIRLAKYAEIISVGRRSGREHRTTVCFAWSQGAVYVLAHCRADGSPGDWYRNVIAAGRGQVQIAGVRMQVRVAPAGDAMVARQLVIALLRHKYGNQAVTTWHPSSGAVPVRLDVIAVEPASSLEAPIAAGQS